MFCNSFDRFWFCVLEFLYVPIENFIVVVLSGMAVPIDKICQHICRYNVWANSTWVNKIHIHVGTENTFDGSKCMECLYLPSNIHISHAIAQWNWYVPLVFQLNFNSEQMFPLFASQGVIIIYCVTLIVPNFETRTRRL